MLASHHRSAITSLASSCWVSCSDRSASLQPSRQRRNAHAIPPDESKQSRPWLQNPPGRLRTAIHTFLWSLSVIFSSPCGCAREGRLRPASPLHNPLPATTISLSFLRF